MTFKECKYCHVTQIQWDDKDSLFREADGRAHDRSRCESIRNKMGTGNGGNSSSSSSVPQQQQQSTIQGSPMATYDVANTLNTILSHVKTQAEGVILINQKLGQLSEYYSGLLDHVKTISGVIKHNQEMADKEEAYDTTKEDGTAYSV